MVDLVPYLWLILKIILVFVAIIFFISGLDDLFIDIYYGLRSLYLWPSFWSPSLSCCCS